MIPCLSSKFVEKINQEDWDKMIMAGVIPVNDPFKPYWETTHRHEVYYGGRGSGKSRFIAEKLVNKCINDKYFKYIYCRKHYADIKESQFDLIKKWITKIGKEKEFKFNETTLRITHNSGNCFVAKGLDNPEKSKGVEEANGIWCEEITELEEIDYITLNQLLRTMVADLCSIVSFNPIHEKNWVRNYFFTKDDPHKVKPELGDVIALRTTLWDNPFINREQYAKDLIAGASGNQNIIRVVLSGDWGQTENGNPWVYNFSLERHVRPVKFNPFMPIYLSFDFNNDPVACIAEQHSEIIGQPSSFIHYICEFVGILKIEELCQQIRARFPNAIFFVTGDRSGSNEDLGRNQTLYQMIQSALGVSDRCMNINTSNLYHADSRMLCNTMLFHYPHMYINGEECPNLITDIQKATVDGNKPLPSALKKDREGYKMDVFDAWRYDLQTYFNEYSKTAYLGVMK